MREIRFRAWCETKKVFITRNYYLGVKYDENDFIDAVFQQYIGLKDRDGKDICEGDLLQGPGDWKTITIVEYDEIVPGDDADCPGIGFELNSFPNELKIVGNIFENPKKARRAKMNF
tara:strand:+ start:36682 stop:37032 length:351 start_codon:yes stop_codon:yes gene_type:complete